MYATTCNRNDLLPASLIHPLPALCSIAATTTLSTSDYPYRTPSLQKSTSDLISIRISVNQAHSKHPISSNLAYFTAPSISVPIKIYSRKLAIQLLIAFSSNSFLPFPLALMHSQNCAVVLHFNSQTPLE